MKNIYSQLVLTFIAVVVASFVVTLLMSDWVFQREQVKYVEDRILKDAKAMAEIQSSLPENMIQKYLDTQGGQMQIVVVGADGTTYRSIGDGPGGPPGFPPPPAPPASTTVAPINTAGKETPTPTDTANQWIIPDTVKQQVLHGDTYHPKSTVSPDDNMMGIHFSFLNSQNEKVPRYVGVPFERDGQNYALFARPAPKHLVNQFNSWMILVLSVMLITGVILFLFAARLIAKPIAKLSEATRRVAKGDYQVRVNVKRKDEIGELSRNFNRMIGELSKIEAMRQEFVSNVSHEIQTPLTSIRGFAGALRDSASPEQVRHLTIIEQESERLSKLSSNLLKLASLDVVKLHTVPFRLDEQIRMSVASCVPLWMEKNIDLSADLDKVTFDGDEDLLSQVWINLLSNAIKFTPEQGNIYMMLTHDQEWIQVSVKDTGCGISPDHLEHIFDRFYKVDTSRTSATGGNGLGLSIVQKIIGLHGGRIEVTSEHGQGTKMTVFLPLASEEPKET